MHSRYLLFGALLASGLGVMNNADAALVLTAAGTSLGFSLSTYYSEPNAYYGLLGVTTTASGNVIAASYAHDTLNLLADTDGQNASTILSSRR